MTPLPDVEALTIEFLLSELGELVGTNISSDLPAAHAMPYLQVQDIGGARKRRQWLASTRIQVDAWADSRDEASVLARTAEAALLETARNFQGANGTITDSEALISARRFPDPSTDRHRFEFEVRIDAHPTPE